MRQPSRVTEPATRLILFDDHDLSNSGPRHGLGLPPPTELIVVPELLRSDDEVFENARIEKRSPKWIAERALFGTRQGASWLLDQAEYYGVRAWTGGEAIAREVVRRLRPLMRQLAQRVAERLSRADVPPTWDTDETTVAPRELR